MFSGCIIKVNIIDWNWDIDSRDNEKIDIGPLHSYFPRYTLLSESIILKEEIGNYQLLRDFDRTENAELLHRNSIRVFSQNKTFHFLIFVY